MSSSPDRRGGVLPRRITDRPVVTVAAMGLVAATAQLWWVHSHRHVGGFGVDESGYLATAFRLHHAWNGGHPGALAWAVLDTPRSGPLVPLMSVPFMAVFGRSTTTAFMAQALLYVVTAVAVTAIVARLSTKAAALIAGAVCLGMPTVIVTARSYQLASGVTAFLCLAVFALLCSERGERRGPMVWFGLSVGAMLMSRTMPLAFLPGLALGAATQVRWNRRVMGNLVLSVGVTLVVAGPWWIYQWGGISSYLFSFGYGHGTTQIESLPWALRAPVRLGIVMIDVRPLLVVPMLLLGVVAGVSLRRWRRAGHPTREWPAAERSILTIWVVVAAGALTLLTSSNNGTWFQSPLEVLAVAPICAMGGRLVGRWVKVAAAASLVAVASNLALISIWTPGATTRNGGATWSIVAFGGVEDQQAQDFEPIEPRFAASASWRDRSAAERDWARGAVEVLAAVDSLHAERKVTLTVVGELDLLNANTLTLTAELTDRNLFVESTAAPEALLDGRVRLDPITGSGPRVLVSVQPHDRHGIKGFDPTETMRQASALGWRQRLIVPLPHGANAIVFTHPQSVAG